MSVALCGYLATVIGYPMPTQTAKKLGQPFPCQDHACGCASAQECWEHCCCFTPAEMLAWARANHVEPPPALLKRATSPSRVAHADHGHCEHCARAASTCCSTPARGAATSHCAHTNGCAHTNDAAHTNDSADADKSHCAACSKHGSHGVAERGENPAVRFVIGPLARQCRGLADSWCSTGAVAPPPPLVLWQFDWTVIERLAQETPLLVSRDLAPPLPPPRV